MKALALTSFEDAPAVIDLPDPVAGPGEVLVRMRAASVNAFDVGVATGAAKEYMAYRFPAGVGMDLVGTVEALGDGVDAFAAGDRVFGMLTLKGEIHDGTFAELATPAVAAIAPAPQALSDIDAGSLCVAGGTAMSAVEAVEPRAGKTVLVVGATGGVGTFAIQLATLRGAHVIASVRPGDEGFVTDLGAAETVDYTKDLDATIRRRYPDGVDAVIDAVNRDQATFANLAGLVSDGGRAVSVVGGAGESSKIGNVAVSNANGDPVHVTALGDLVVGGKLRVAVRQTYSLADAAQALTDFAAKHTLGKLVITMP
ncbi:MAG: NADPH:quinone reductase [Actinomycetota bacterium]|nr:NADPH:quinone reductase [Actinomycetota bacterium]